MFDSAQRNIHYLRLSVTDLCNLRCRYCMPDGVEKLEREAVLTYEEFLRLATCLPVRRRYRPRHRRRTAGAQGRRPAGGGAEIHPRHPQSHHDHKRPSCWRSSLPGLLACLLHADAGFAPKLFPAAALHLSLLAGGVLGPKAVAVAHKFRCSFCSSSGS